MDRASLPNDFHHLVDKINGYSDLCILLHYNSEARAVTSYCSNAWDRFIPLCHRFSTIFQKTCQDYKNSKTVKAAKDKEAKELMAVGLNKRDHAAPPSKNIAKRKQPIILRKRKNPGDNVQTGITQSVGIQRLTENGTADSIQTRDKSKPESKFLQRLAENGTGETFQTQDKSMLEFSQRLTASGTWENIRTHDESIPESGFSQRLTATGTADTAQTHDKSILESEFSQRLTETGTVDTIQTHDESIPESGFSQRLTETGNANTIQTQDKSILESELSQRLTETGTVNTIQTHDKSIPESGFSQRLTATGTVNTIQTHDKSIPESGFSQRLTETGTVDTIKTLIKSIPESGFSQNLLRLDLLKNTVQHAAEEGHSDGAKILPETSTNEPSVQIPQARTQSVCRQDSSEKSQRNEENIVTRERGTKRKLGSPDKKSLQLDACTETTESRSCFKIVKQSRNSESRMCLECRKSFVSSDALLQHMIALNHDQDVKEPTDFQCLFCRKYFKEAWHIEFHGKLTGCTRNKSLFLSWVCFVCNRKFKDKASLNIHITHTNHQQISYTKTNFNCEICDKYFLRQWDLDFHVKRHHWMQITDTSFLLQNQIQVCNNEMENNGTKIVECISNTNIKQHEDSYTSIGQSEECNTNIEDDEECNKDVKQSEECNTNVKQSEGCNTNANQIEECNTNVKQSEECYTNVNQCEGYNTNNVKQCEECTLDNEHDEECNTYIGHSEECNTSMENDEEGNINMENNKECNTNREWSVDEQCNIDIKEECNSSIETYQQNDKNMTPEKECDTDRKEENECNINLIQDEQCITYIEQDEQSSCNISRKEEDQCNINIEQDEQCITNIDEDEQCITNIDQDEQSITNIDQDEQCITNIEQDEQCITNIEQDEQCFANIEQDTQCITNIEQDTQCITNIEQDEQCITNIEQDEQCITNIEQDEQCITNIEQDTQCITNIEQDTQCITNIEQDTQCITNIEQDEQCITNIEQDTQCITNIEQDEQCTCNIDNEVEDSNFYPRPCIICYEVFNSSNLFYKHVHKSSHEQITIRKTPFKCVVCQTFFISKNDLLHHDASCEKPGSQEKYRCKVCRKTFPTAKLFNLHTASPFECGTCNYTNCNRNKVYSHCALAGHDYAVTKYMQIGKPNDLDREEKNGRRHRGKELGRKKREKEIERRQKEKEVGRKQREREIKRKQREKEIERKQKEKEVGRKQREKKIERKQREKKTERKQREKKTERKQGEKKTERKQGEKKTERKQGEKKTERKQREKKREENESEDADGEQPVAGDLIMEVEECKTEHSDEDVNVCNEKQNNNENNEGIMCRVCRKFFSRTGYFRKHIKFMKHEQKSLQQTEFECRKCHQFFVSSWDLKMHEHFEFDGGDCRKDPIDKQPEVPLICVQCETPYKKMNALRKHIVSTKHEQISPKETDFKCFMCEKFFVGDWDLTFHMIERGHLGDGRPSVRGKPLDRWKNERCVTCKMEFESLEMLRSHIDSTQHEQFSEKTTSYQCLECELYFCREWDLIYHHKMYGHFNVGNQADQNCDHMYMKPKSLPKLSETDVAASVERFENICLQCSRYFKYTEDLRKHMLWYSHDKEGKDCNYKTGFKCFTCGSYFLRRIDLECHMTRTRHSGRWKPEEERRMIQICSFESEVAKMKASSQVFMGIKFQCSACKEVFETATECRIHLQEVLFCGQPKLKCPIEGCFLHQFTSINFQQTHIAQQHSEDFPFRCKDCPLVFFDVKNFNSHSLKHEYESCPRPSTRTAESKKEQLHIMKLQRKIRGIDDKDAVIPDKLDVPQTCLTCSEKFEDFYHLRIHIMGSGHEQIVKEETGFTCFTCDSNFVKFADLELHMYMTAHHGNPMRTGERKIEMVDHFTENRKCPYRCSLCLRTFQKQEYIENHIKAGDCIMRWRHKCPCCDLNFYSRNLYEAHMYQCHHYEFPFKCEHEECSLSKFKTVAGYTMHRKSHENIVKQGISNKKMIKCQICDRMFINYARFSAHRKKEHPPTGSNGFKCQICGKIFFSNAALKRHTKVHAATGSILHRVIEESKEETIYRCFSCDTFYKNKPDLTLHMKQTNHHGLPEQEKDIHLESVINDGREITRCSRCLFVFKTLKKAKLHIRSATCKITFQKKCPLCKTSFFSLNLYEVHLKEKCSSHSGTNGLDEELICEQCGFQTLRRRELNTHMRQKHGQKSRAKTSKILAPKRKRSKTAKKMTYQSSEDETTSESEEANKPEDLDTIIDEDVITSKSEDREPEDLDAVKDSEDQIAGDETTSESENKELEDLDTVKDVKDQLGDKNLQDFSNHSEEEGQENSMDLLDLSPEFASESEQLLFDLLL